MTPSFTNCRSFQGFWDFHARLAIIIAVVLLIAVTNGCTYTRIGVDHETGNRNVFTLGLPTQIEGSGIKADNRINMFEGISVKK